MQSVLESDHSNMNELDLETQKKRYRAVLLNASTTKSRDPIANLYPWHCKEAVGQLLRHANSELRHNSGLQISVLTGTFPSHVYGGECRDLLEKFLHAGGLFKVIAWNEITDGAEKEIENAYPTQVAIKRAKMGPCKAITAPPHFLLVGSNAYRYEAPHDSYDPESFTDFSPEVPARICFNDEEGGHQLRDFFDALWKLDLKK